MMRNIAAVMILAMLTVNFANGETNVVMNGSFEQNGYIDDITTEAPARWCDVNIPAGFNGAVSFNWWTHGSYCLVLFVERGTHAAGDMASVSQEVYLTDVNEIIFDLKLSTSSIWDSWDPNCSAIVQIDDTVVWDSNDYPNVSVYIDETIDISDINEVNDPNLHTLSLIVRANQQCNLDEERNIAYWDFIKFDTHCGGFGYLATDLNHDCYVDFNDLRLLAENWLDDVNDRYDLYADGEGVFDFHDYAVFAYDWVHNTDWENRYDEGCFEMSLLSADLNDDGVVDLRDFAVLGKNWMIEDDCVRGDIDCSGVVDYYDFSELGSQWLDKSWLYDTQ